MRIFRLFITAVAALVLTACTDYQDELDALDARVKYLESMRSTIERMNQELSDLQKLVNAMDSLDYITRIDTIYNEDGTARGVVIVFKYADPITIKNGDKGDKGDAGNAPVISVAQDPDDGDYYWTINGEWLVIDGQRIRANGHNLRWAASRSASLCAVSCDRASNSLRRAEKNPSNFARSS